MTATAPDLLDLLEASAALSTLTPGKVREAWLAAIQHVSDRDGDWDSGRVRAELPEWAHGPESGAVVTGLVRSKAAVWTGHMATLGNTTQRAGGRLVKVYRLTAKINITGEKS